jgi:Mn2+/Fe2+ NRAMP family transporter
VALGVDTMGALVLGQVVLSLALPVPMIALVMFTRRADLMGRFATRGLLHAAAVSGTIIVLRSTCFSSRRRSGTRSRAKVRKRWGCGTLFAL